MKPVAIVIPWFGRELKGGAEQLAWQVATRLAARNHSIEVLTTCCRAFLEDWSVNHYKAGEYRNDNLLVRRFKVDRRNSDRFVATNEHLLSIPKERLRPGTYPFAPAADHTFVSENIQSKALMKWLKKKANNYKSFIFLPYLYGPIIKGLPIVAKKSFLQPCLHNEVYAYLPQVDNIFRMCKGILYNSMGEESLAENIYGPGIILKGRFMGVGIENCGQTLNNYPEMIGNIDVKNQKYIFCLGRRDKTKNIDFLVKVFQAYHSVSADSDLILVLAGPGEHSYHEPNNGIYDLGLVTEVEKESLLANCLALFQPSENESYSRVMMEAWIYERPVVVHKNCLSTAMAVKSAKGGWIAGNLHEWVATLIKIVQLLPEELTDIGLNGSLFANEYADWDKVIDRYEEYLGLNIKENDSNDEVRSSYAGGKTVHQLTPGFTSGDAISNQSMFIRDYLRSSGYHSNIYVNHLAPEMENEASKLNSQNLPAQKDGIIYHHSIGSSLAEIAREHRGPKSLIYHNITPSQLVANENPKLAKELDEGRKELKRLSDSFNLAAGDSAYNAAELSENGFNVPTILPICVDPKRWNHPPDHAIMNNMQDNKKNLLFVGRIVPNKCQLDLIETFYCYLHMEPDARLILVGGFDSSELYYNKLVEKIKQLRIESEVVFTGKVTEPQLQAYYRTAHLYWSMSEHEGFGVPLIEAMWFDVPVLAYKSSAVPETLGNAGLLFADKENLPEIAALAVVLCKDPQTRRKVIRAQKNRRMDFLPETIYPKINDMIKKMYHN